MTKRVTKTKAKSLKWAKDPDLSAPIELSGLIADGLNLLIGEEQLKPEDVEPRTLNRIWKELLTHRYQVGALPVPADMVAFIEILFALKVLGGYGPAWGEGLAESLNLQRQGVVRLLEAAAKEIGSKRFQHEWERPIGAAPQQYAELVPVDPIVPTTGKERTHAFKKPEPQS